MERDLTQGSVLKNLIKHALPFFASSFLQTLYGMTDLVIIGQYEGVKSTTAVAIGSQVMHMITVIIVAVAVGCSVVVGSAVKNGDKRDIEKKLGTIISFFSIIALSLTVLLFLLSDLIVYWMGTPSLATEGTRDYLRICFLGIPFIVVYNVLSSIYRALGEEKTPVIFVLAATLTNIVLDILFMGYMGMGAKGAALGTLLSEAVSVFFAVIHLLAVKKEIRIKKEDFRIDKKIVEAITEVGSPLATYEALIQTAFILITMIMNRRGIIDAAAAGIVEKVISILILVPSALYSSVAAISKKCIENGDEKMAKETMLAAMMFSVILGLGASFVVQTSARDLVALFTSDPAVIRNGAEYLRGYVYETIFAGIHFALSGYFTALGLSGVTSAHNVISIVFMRIPGVYFLSLLYPTNLFPVGLASASGSVLSSVICICIYIYLDKFKKINYQSR